MMGNFMGGIISTPLLLLVLTSWVRFVFGISNRTCPLPVHAYRPVHPRRRMISFTAQQRYDSSDSRRYPSRNLVVSDSESIVDPLLGPGNLPLPPRPSCHPHCAMTLVGRSSTSHCSQHRTTWFL
ncbi:hypothetical protein BGW80DRAFT_748549 [Lactifluus volemus]|nr:hypothetical protein BGW80DRAFT_748549 [Lactifluus volemus]